MTGVNKEQKNAGQTVSQNMSTEGNWHSNLTFAEAVVHFMQNHTQTMATLQHQAHLISAYLTCRAIADTTVGDKCKPKEQSRMRGSRCEVEEEHMVYGDLVSFACLLFIPSSPATPGITTPCGIWRPAKNVTFFN